MTERSSMLHVRMDNDLKVPNAETRSAMAEAEDILSAGRMRFVTADELFADLERTGRQ